MLKKISILLLTLLLVGCKPTQTTHTSSNSYSILSYTGVASLSLICLTPEDNEITITDNYDDISNAFDDKSYDVIIAPINTGVSKCLDNNNYKLLSIVAYGNYYLVSSDSALARGGIAVYNQAVAEPILNSLSSDLDNYDFQYYDSVDEIYNLLSNGEVDGALVNELIYNDFVDYRGLELNKVLDIQDLYQTDNGYSSYPIYGMFILSSIANNDQDALSEFAKTIKNSITQYKNDKNTFKNVLDNYDLEKIGFDNAELVSESYNYCGIDFVYATSDYDSLEAYLKLFDIELNEKIVIR